MDARTHGRDLAQAAQEYRESRAGEDPQPAGPLATLSAIRQERTRLAAVELDTVRVLRSVGTPWAMIGRALGITGQAAAKRYAGLLDA